ncbi:MULTISPECIES: hypothetical protein [unclassified Brucella]|uniref:hypothetical protein n=1 Tax=unclassified Brucella TaxID=2632610 RepID=UPI0012AD986F|nr:MULTISPECIES: hypothetical protein [unclassified Brucella]MRN43461.1 hypothetical protein [Brucella sp. 09RB8913]MRN59436.1 hypothetical protein [Brucella sp. 09RB8918]MRN67969.1 hypothetical protein [Brucella sp. 10RB9213]
MTHFKSDAAKGKTPVTYPRGAGYATTQRYVATIPATAAVGDIVEIACIPPGCRPVEAVIDADGAVSGDIGVMTGDWGKADDARTCGSEIAAAQDLTADAVFRPTKPSAYRIPSNDAARGIGVKITTAPTAAVAIGITLTVVA